MFFLLALGHAASAYATGRPPARVWLPEGISTYSGDLDRLFNVILIITGTVFVLVEAVLIYFLFRYRRRPGKRAVYSHGHMGLEVVWTLIPALILAGLGLASHKTWMLIRSPRSLPQDAVQIEVLAEQFQWNIRYPGADGKFGRIKPELMKATNTFGLDPDDPAGLDDIVKINYLVMPVNKPVIFKILSKDVIHSFFIPEFRLKQDAVPGMEIKAWVQATKTGDYFEIMCAELCGLAHYRMRGTLKIVTGEEFQQWLEDNAPEPEEY